MTMQQPLPKKLPGSVRKADTETDRQIRVDRFFFSKLPKTTMIADQELFHMDENNTQFPISVLEPNRDAWNGVLYYFYSDDSSTKSYSQMQTKIDLTYSQLQGFPEAVLPTSKIQKYKKAISFIPSSEVSGYAHYERVVIMEDYSETKDDKVNCKLIDSGHSLDLNIKALYYLLENFAKLPARIYYVQLEDVGFYRYSIILWTFIYKMQLEKNKNLTLEFTNTPKENYPRGILRDRSKPTEISINEKVLHLILEMNKDCIQFNELNSVIPEIQVTFVNRNFDVFVKKRSTPNFRHLRFILKQLSSQEYIGSHPEDLAEEQIYLLEDPTQGFQRVKIIQPITDEGAQVFFVDLGTESDGIIPAGQLVAAKGLETKFPCQCMKIKLRDIIEIPEELYAEIAPEIRNLYEGKKFNAIVFDKDPTADVPITLELFYPRSKGTKTLLNELQKLIYKNTYQSDNTEAVAETLRPNLRWMEERLCQHEPIAIFSIKWINPKYVEGTELKVFVESVENDEDLVIVEVEDRKTRKIIQNQLKEQQKENATLDFTRATVKMMEDVEGMSLFMMPMIPDSKILCRVALMRLVDPSGKTLPWKSTCETLKTDPIVQVYLIDHGIMKETTLSNLHLLIPRYFYVPPPMAVKAKIIPRPGENFKIKNLQGRIRKVEILSVVHSSPPLSDTKTKVKIQFID